jgi:predicted nucleic acid-binding protein
MVTTAAEEWFVDTNILVYATDPQSPWHGRALAELNRARRLGIELVISPQVLREYLAIATRSVVGNPKVADAVENVRTFQEELTVVEAGLAATAGLLELIVKYGVAGKRVHDANLVSTMLLHGIRQILTHNVADFARFAGLITVIPLVPEEGATREPGEAPSPTAEDRP